MISFDSLYTFDTRWLKNPAKVHKGHTSAVIDVDYAPTGKEFVSGAYDKTLRIFDVHKANSRDVYHTKRMQHITCVGWSQDNRYIYNGSDEMNIRLWKANASEKLGALRPREKMAKRQNDALKEKFAAHPQVKRIANHRQVPKKVYNDQRKQDASRQKEVRKEDNRRRHSKPGAVPYVAEQKKHVINEYK